ncbi:MAG TPA: glutathione S-transferase family protein [Solirubrobacteraceae bacterium]|jgi:glutathione S-transferase|nr:glutathione S-transferase family protein [Solirubrobacteraceae bacterium]
MLRIHGYPVSTYTRTATMACIEKGVAHELVPIEYGSAAHVALHPFSRIPVLEHDDTVIFETLAITSYIDEAFAGLALQPTDALARARMLEWVGLCSDYVYRDVVRGLPRKRPPNDEELCAARSALRRLDGLIGDRFLAGDALSLADLYLAPQISNACEKLGDALDQLDSLRAWYERLARRESFRRTAYDPASL